VILLHFSSPGPVEMTLSEGHLIVDLTQISPISSALLVSYLQSLFVHSPACFCSRPFTPKTHFYSVLERIESASTAGTAEKLTVVAVGLG
jgi:hypothetical protein